MKVTYYASSTVLVEAGGKKILMDPWLEDGEYYGSWAHYPPVEVDYREFADVDLIYIAHIHPDHMSKATLGRLDKSIPVLIHRYDAKFLKRNIEAQGFVVEELAHGGTKRLSPDLAITIFAADDCDPDLCGAFFHCAPPEGRSGSTQIDSLCVVEGDGEVLVNANDCQYGLTRHLLPRIRERFGTIDMLLAGYSGAGPYPQCFSNLTGEAKRKAAAAKKAQFLRQALNYIRDLKPRTMLPLAGQYTLAGPLHRLNDLRGTPDLEEARAHLRERLPAGQTEIVLLARGGSVDISSGQVDKPYVQPTAEERERYVRETLAARAYDFENDPEPALDELVALARAAATRVEAKRQQMGIESATLVYVRLSDDLLAKVSLAGEPIEFVERAPMNGEAYVTMAVDPRLLRRILAGPHLAHWNNATIGSHVTFDRHPNRYDREVYLAMNYFHA